MAVSAVLNAEKLGDERPVILPLDPDGHLERHAHAVPGHRFAGSAALAPAAAPSPGTALVKPCSSL